MRSQVAQICDAAPASDVLTDSPIEILTHVVEAFRAGIGVALVTLVEIRGGAARSLGAQMSVRADGQYRGFVSGGCTEASVAAEALEALKSGHDRFLNLGEGSPFFDIVLPCGGGIRLAIHMVRDVEPIRQVLCQLKARRMAGLLYQPEAETISASSSAVAGWDRDGFTVLYRPATRILLCGGSLELEATRKVAIAADYEVEQISRLTPDTAHMLAIDEFCAVAMLWHDLERELPVLSRALASPAFYIGALGSRRTHEKRCAALRALGHSDRDIARIKAPIGIFDKARNASSIALSVVADIAAAAR
jgi:xanthine dehydrogenase accessory factor